MTTRDWDFLIWEKANDLLEQAERIQINFLQAIAGSRYSTARAGRGGWTPSVNIVETDAAWWVMCALPGVEPDQVEVRLEAGELVISGTRPAPPCCREGDLRLWEIPLGRFERRLSLTLGARFTIGEARLEDGLFLLELKKVS
jgi:HSP20 family molecular chaperone IbpA